MTSRFFTYFSVSTAFGAMALGCGGTSDPGLLTQSTESAVLAAWTDDAQRIAIGHGRAARISDDRRFVLIRDGYDAHASWTPWEIPSGRRVTHVALGEDLMAVVLDDGLAYFKKGDDDWVALDGRAKRLMIRGNRLGIMQVDGSFLVGTPFDPTNAIHSDELSLPEPTVRALAVDGNWVAIVDNARVVKLAKIERDGLLTRPKALDFSDATSVAISESAQRAAVIDTSNRVWIRSFATVEPAPAAKEKKTRRKRVAEAPPPAPALGWTLVAQDAKEVALSGDAIAILHRNGTLAVSESSVDGPWTTYDGQFEDIALADGQIAALSSNGFFTKPIVGGRWLGVPMLTSEISGEMKEAIREHTPTMWLHADEEYFPSSVEFFLQNNVNVVCKDGSWRGRRADAVLMRPLSRAGMKTSSGCAFVAPLDANSLFDIPDFLKGEEGRFRHGGNPPPIYVTVYPSTPGDPSNFFAQYSAFYPFNAGQVVCPALLVNGFCPAETIKQGYHVGDWEGFSVKFENFKPVQAVTRTHGSQHISHVDRKAYEALTQARKRLDIFAAKGGHGTWTETGNHPYQGVLRATIKLRRHAINHVALVSKHPRALIKAFLTPFIDGEIRIGQDLVDATERALPWEMEKNIVYYDAATPWFQYRGDWGNGPMGRRICDHIEVISHVLSGVTRAARAAVTFFTFGRRDTDFDLKETVCKAAGIEKQFEIVAGPNGPEPLRDFDDFAD